MKLINYTATWDGTKYVCLGTYQWYSEDGNNWYSAPGIAPTGPFELARITLVGGPRDGTTVR